MICTFFRSSASADRSIDIAGDTQTDISDSFVWPRWRRLPIWRQAKRIRDVLFESEYLVGGLAWAHTRASECTCWVHAARMTPMRA